MCLHVQISKKKFAFRINNLIRNSPVVEGWNVQLLNQTKSQIASAEYA